MRYARKPKHHENVKVFAEIERDYDLNLSFPSPEKAPWHEQGIINGHFVNFWPCALTAQRDGDYSVKGDEDIREMLDACLAYGPEEIEVIDDE